MELCVFLDGKLVYVHVFACRSGSLTAFSVSFSPPFLRSGSLVKCFFLSLLLRSGSVAVVFSSRPTSAQRQPSSFFSLAQRQSGGVPLRVSVASRGSLAAPSFFFSPCACGTSVYIGSN
jgi:hypothetical protein